MKKIILFLFLTSCINLNENFNKDKEVLKFNDDLNFEEFNLLLIKYAKINPYPDIDK